MEKSSIRPLLLSQPPFLCSFALLPSPFFSRLLLFFFLPFLSNLRLGLSTVVTALLLVLFSHLLCPLFFSFFRHSVSFLYELPRANLQPGVSFSKEVNCAHRLLLSSLFLAEKARNWGSSSTTKIYAYEYISLPLNIQV